MKKIYALVDCNNFFVSCERLFDPSSRNIPAVVFSNNEGCVIARSNEAKRIGIKMGEPVFQCKDLLDLFGVKGYSTNFALYKDISERVMSILESFSPNIQVYSVDEAFLELTDLNISNLEDFAKNIKDSIYNYVGIPVSVGIAPTKTLAKVASKLAKKSSGVFVLVNELENILKDFPVGDVWGIGYATTKKLFKLDIRTALGYIKLESKYILKHFGITGLRTWWELKGENSDAHSSQDSTPKSMAHTRTFKTPITEFNILKARIAHFSTSISTQLREGNLVCNEIFVFVRENKKSKEYYRNFASLTLPEHTNLRSEIVKATSKLLSNIFEIGKKYKKAGVIVTGITNRDKMIALFLSNQGDNKEKVETAVDKINVKWSGSIKLGSELIQNSDVSRLQTPHYTTDWRELKIVL